MEFFRIRKDIPFMKYALIFNVISILTFVLAVFFLVTRGLHLSVEFTGRHRHGGVLHPGGRPAQGARDGGQPGLPRRGGAKLLAPPAM